MTAVLRLPHLGVADESVLLVAWLVEEGTSVRPGQAVACVETLKASFEVEAEQEGALLHRLVPAGERVAPLAALALIGAPGEELSPEAQRLLDGAQPRAPAAALAAAPAQAPAPAVPAPEPPAAPPARRRARELGLDLVGVRGSGPEGLVRLADVERAHAERASGRLDPQFLAFLRAEGEAFGRLSSAFRLALYRRHGAVIGADCELGPGAVLLCERLVLGAGARIGADCHVEARELVAGELLHLGPRCRVRCTRVVLGDNAFLAEEVEIGGGGARDPEAELVIGSHGFVGERVHVNPCRPVSIGDEVVLSRGAVLMTHSFGASVLKGYPSRFAGIAIGEGAQIGIGAVLFPGVSVGAGAIVLSGSSLVSSVPPGRLFGGVPAVDLKAAATPLGPEELERKARELVGEFARQLALRGFELETSEHGAELRVGVRRDGALHLLRFAPAELDELAAAPAEELRVSLLPQPGAWEQAAPGRTQIDLSRPEIRGASGPLASAWREFLRKRGVRLHPRGWAYRGGWL
jgi:acetyltransferase-like isoleucine patch superfamily enzyme